MRTDRVEVCFRATTALDQETIDQALETLSPAERARHSRFMFAEDRRDYAAAHALLRHMLSRAFERDPRSWVFETAPDGKPILAQDSSPTCAFSLTHTRGLVACAIAPDGQLGIDVESTLRNPDVLSLAERYFSQQEADDLSRCDPEARSVLFSELWTLKESHLKAIGKGLAGSLTAAVFDLSSPADIRVSLGPSAAHDRPWRFAVYEPLASYRLALAYDGPADRTVHLAAWDAGAATGSLAALRWSR